MKIWESILIVALFVVGIVGVLVFNKYDLNDFLLLNKGISANQTVEEQLDASTEKVPDVVKPKTSNAFSALINKVKPEVPAAKQKLTKDELDKLFKEVDTQLGSLKGEYSLVIKTPEYEFKSNSTKEYYAASLFKLPVAVETLKYFETTPGMPAETKTFLDNNLDVLIKNSDNGAQDAILNYLGYSLLQQSFGALINEPNGDFYNYNKATPEKVVQLLQGLNTTTYISGDSRARLLKLMTQTVYNDRISDHLDKSLVFSHKIGNWGATGSWHDCGIVTQPTTVYVCLMSEYTTFEDFLIAGKSTAGFINKLF